MPYIYSEVIKLENTEKVGTHHCVPLVQHYAQVPNTSQWKQGKKVLGNKEILKGTAIATFKNGRYSNNSTGNHAAFYISQSDKGIKVMDQWKGPKKPKVSSRTIWSKGITSNSSPSNNADMYYVIL